MVPEIARVSSSSVLEASMTQRPEHEVSGLDTGTGDDNRGKWENLSGLERWGKPNGDHSQDRHDCIARWTYFDPLQSICLRINVGISMSLRSCSGDDRSRSGVTGELPAGGVGIFRRGSSASGFLVTPFPRGGRSGMTGDPLTIGDWVRIACSEPGPSWSEDGRSRSR